MKQTATGLVVIGDLPSEQQDRPLRCGLCEASFRLDEMGAYDRHVFRCANSETAERAEAMSPRKYAPGIYDPLKAGDVELGQWFRQNRKAIAEGRVKP